ncbi:hypothetical protein ANN_17756 [Periplaneta americana]|uniref:PiggyBac transposable element-derived protein domain-containing protein n=1 Tax=Periplaneta americana TaxID=6978 RepID=A0ABQ8SV66_PERAM|nr:hypothetical protein ANN_17756 [Periplaneta americana]
MSRNRFRDLLSSVLMIRTQDRSCQKACSPIKDTGRNVTTDRFYTSVELAEDLHECKITLVGTMLNNRRHIPEELKAITGRKLNSSKFAFTDPANHLSR